MAGAGAGTPPRRWSARRLAAALASGGLPEVAECGGEARHPDQAGGGEAGGEGRKRRRGLGSPGIGETRADVTTSLARRLLPYAFDGEPVSSVLQRFAALEDVLGAGAGATGELSDAQVDEVFRRTAPLLAAGLGRDGHGRGGEEGGGGDGYEDGHEGCSKNAEGVSKEGTTDRAQAGIKPDTLREVAVRRSGREGDDEVAVTVAVSVGVAPSEGSAPTSTSFPHATALADLARTFGASRPPFFAVLLSPAWLASAPGMCPSPSCLAVLDRVPLEAICASGAYLYAWSVPHLSPLIASRLEARGFAYADTLTWVPLGEGGRVRAVCPDSVAPPVPGRGAVLRRSHLSLLVFRRVIAETAAERTGGHAGPAACPLHSSGVEEVRGSGEVSGSTRDASGGESPEACRCSRPVLRHQRSADVVFEWPVADGEAGVRC